MADVIPGLEMEEEPGDARVAQLAEHGKRLGWAVEGEASGGSQYSLRPPTAREGAVLTVRLDRQHLWICVPDVLTVDRRARRAVLDTIGQIHWETFLPKFECSPRGTEVRASWWLPAYPELPPYPVFEQTLSAVWAEAERHWDRLHEANRKTSHVTSIRDSGERLAEAAELCNLGRDLVELAATKEILPMYVRADLVRQVITLLDGPRRLVLLVGEPGTGKNAVVYALATWIAAGDTRVASSSMKDARVYECTPASFQSSCLYANELETKIGIIAQNCLRENAVLFLDNANLAVTAGRFTENPERTVANLLLPVLSRGEIAMIAATTPVGLQTMQRTNPQFARLFQVVAIPEPTVAETKHMVQDRMEKVQAGLTGGQAYHFEAGVGDTVVSVAAEFLRSRRFPGKALELLNEVLAYK